MWQHSSGDLLVRTTSYGLPHYLHDHIELIQPTTMFARWKSSLAPALYHDEDELSIQLATQLTTPGVDPSCGTRITLSCIMQLYSAFGYEPKATKKNAIGITGFLNQSASLRDLTSFYHDQLPAAVNSSFQLVLVHGMSLDVTTFCLLIDRL